jgi:hypothetical protein
MKRIFFTIWLASTAMAQVGFPTLGYLPDGGTIRAMTGIASSASIGPLLGGGAVTFTQVVVASGGGFSLASLPGGGVVVVTVASDGVTLNTAPIAGAIAGTLYLSPNGSSGLIANGGQLQVITGLPGSPAVQPAVDTSYLGAATALAVSDDGQWIAGVFGGAVYALGASGQAIALPAPAGVTALTFFHGTDDLAVTTAIQIFEISGIGGIPTITTIFGSPNTPVPSEAPIALALSADNSVVVLLEPDGGIGQVVLATGAVSTANCGCTPQGLSGLGGAAFLVSNLAGGSSVKVYDAASGSVWFVPLAATSTQGGQQ